MKQKTFFLMMMFLTLIVSGCQQKSSSKKSSSTSNPVVNCLNQGNWTAQGCPGYVPNNSTVVCTGQAYWTTPGCTGYCQSYPTVAACNGTTTGGTTGGSGGINTGMCVINPSAAYCSATYCSVFPKPYGCLANGTNCYMNPTAAGCGGSSTTVAANPYWGVKYPPSNVAPVGSCSSTYNPPGLTTASDVRKGTIVITGKGKYSADPETEYSPFSPDAPNYLNTSTMLKSVAQAKLFFLTDSVLKFRVKVRQEPDSKGTTGAAACYGRQTGTYLAGYTKLQYYVKVYATTAGNGFSYMDTLGPFITGVNDCSPAIDLSAYQEASPTGLIVTINDVRENKDCSNWSWNSTGWSTCSVFNKVRSLECWSMDFEVAADGTKTFD